MQTLKDKAKRDNVVMHILKVAEIRHFISRTDKGDIYMILTKGQDEKGYKFYLDAVPVGKDENKSLMKLFDGVLFQI